MRIEITRSPSETLAEFSDKRNGTVRLTQQRDMQWVAEIDASFKTDFGEAATFGNLRTGNTPHEALKELCRYIGSVSLSWPSQFDRNGTRQWHAPRISGIFQPDDWDTAVLEPAENTAIST